MDEVLVAIRDNAAHMFETGHGNSGIRLLCEAIGDDRKHALIAELARRVAESTANPQAQRRSYSQIAVARGYKPAAVLETARLLAAAGLLEQAIAFLSLGYGQDDPHAAYYRAQWAMRLGDYPQVIAATELAIASMLRARGSVAAVIDRALAGERPEALLTFTRADVVRLARLREPFVLRWHALHRSGDAEASKLRELCIRWWPERVSVWEAAGNHALDDQQPAAAESYFNHALELEPNSTTALAGRAIVRELQKDWPGGLELRKRLADTTAAWSAEDPASLHRVIRYAANLGRLNRWLEAAPHLRRAVRCAAFTKLAVERGVLLRVFSDQLYAPALIAGMLAQAPEAQHTATAAVLLALRDAVALADVAQQLRAHDASAGSLPVALGLVAWQAGDVDAAQRSFLQALAGAPEDMVVQHLACSAAIESGAAEQHVMQQAAVALARRVSASTRNTDEVRFYAALTLSRAGEPRGAAGPQAAPLQALLDLPRPAAAAGLEIATIPLPDHQPHALRDRLLWWTALREAATVAGYTPGSAGQLSARARWLGYSALPG